MSMLRSSGLRSYPRSIISDRPILEEYFIASVAVIGSHRNDGEIVGDSAALYQSEAGKKGIGSVVSGFADRGKPRNGKSAPVVGTVSRVTSAGRPIGGSYVPFVGRSHGQEFYEDG